MTTHAGAVHAATATLAIFAPLVAEAATAFTARGNRLLAGACALVVVAGLALSPLFGFGTGQRVAVGARVAWLLSIGGERSAGGVSASQSNRETD